jgi:hypothetical protein
VPAARKTLSTWPATAVRAVMPCPPFRWSSLLEAVEGRAAGRPIRQIRPTEIAMPTAAQVGSAPVVRQRFFGIPAPNDDAVAIARAAVSECWL